MSGYEIELMVHLGKYSGYVTLGVVRKWFDIEWFSGNYHHDVTLSFCGLALCLAVEDRTIKQGKSWG